jgi:hypothetical protein
MDKIISDLNVALINAEQEERMRDMEEVKENFECNEQCGGGGGNVSFLESSDGKKAVLLVSLLFLIPVVFRKKI